MRHPPRAVSPGEILVVGKSEALMRDVICKHHPRFRNSRAVRKFGLECPDHFNVERLVEEAMAHLGDYDFVDGDHHDFSDFSDCKTASIRSAPLVAGQNSYVGEISGVSTAGGGMKAGSLRCVIFNPHAPNGGFLHYFLPRSFWVNHITIHPSSKVGKIMYTYNRKTGDIPKFRGYECVGFEELAQAK